jgi:energy-coupling factor transport system substrate-specific component
MNRTRLLKVTVLCILSASGNALGSYLHIKTGIPLYIDTIFNAAICFSAGLVSGIITGTLLFPVMNYWVNIILRGPLGELGFFRNIWVICIVVEILLVWFFYKKMKEEEAVFLENPCLHTFIGVAAQLLVLAVLDCILISVTGGIIDYILSSFSMPRTFSPEDNFKLGLLRNNVPLLATAVLSRIPINIVDRFIVIFGGYGISLLFRKWLDKRTLS